VYSYNVIFSIRSTRVTPSISKVSTGVSFSRPISASTSQLDLSLANFFTNDKNDNNKTKAAVSKRISKKVMVKKFLTRAALALCTLTFFQSPAVAAAKANAEAVEHLHTGQKIANFFMQFGLPQWAVLAIISAMPVVELRGAIPVGIWFGMPIASVIPICVLGNMAPIVILLYLLRNEGLK
jgi:hypothetical protein